MSLSLISNLQQQNYSCQTDLIAQSVWFKFFSELATTQIAYVHSTSHLFSEHLKNFWKTILLMYLITVICLCSLWQKWKKQLSSCRTFLRGISTALLNIEIWCLLYGMSPVVTAMNLQELDCCGWAWKGNMFLWWIGNRMELLWTPSFCQSVRTSNPLSITTFTENMFLFIGLVNACFSERDISYLTLCFYLSFAVLHFLHQKLKFTPKLISEPNIQCTF